MYLLSEEKLSFQLLYVKDAILQAQLFEKKLLWLTVEKPS